MADDNLSPTWGVITCEPVSRVRIVNNRWEPLPALRRARRAWRWFRSCFFTLGAVSLVADSVVLAERGHAALAVFLGADACLLSLAVGLLAKKDV